MSFKILPLVLGIFVPSFSFAQTSQEPSKPNIYTFRLYNAENNVKEATAILTQLTAASAVSYNAADSTFSVTTVRELDTQIISGKLQKNFYPVKSVSKTDRSFPKFVDTGNPEHDALDYDARKAKWISENPEEYKILISNPSKK